MEHPDLPPALSSRKNPSVTHWGTNGEHLGENHHPLVLNGHVVGYRDTPFSDPVLSSHLVSAGRDDAPAWLQPTPELHPSSCRPSTPHCRLPGPGPGQSQASPISAGNRSTKHAICKVPSDAVCSHEKKIIKKQYMLFCTFSRSGPGPGPLQHLVGGGTSESHWPRIEPHLIQLDEFHRPQQPKNGHGWPWC